MHIVFVCTGNICRSAFAEVLARKLFKEAEIPSYTFSSCGVIAKKGNTPPKTAQKVAKEQFQVSLKEHKSQPISQDLLSSADLILCMDSTHKEHINMNYPLLADTTKLFMHHEKKAWWESSTVPDPLGGSEKKFMHIFAKIEKKIKSWLSENA